MNIGFGYLLLFGILTSPLIFWLWHITAKTLGKDSYKMVFSILLILSFTTLTYAENFIGLKLGQTKYVSEKDSIYQGSHIYEGNEAFGVVLGHKNNNWIYRLDIEKFRTGVEFSNTFPTSYDGVRINQYPVILSLGRQFGIFYGLLGAGYIINDADIWNYPETPFEAKMNNSPCLALTLGLEADITKKLYGFIEGRYIYSKADVEVSGFDSFTEDLSNTTLWFGLGRKF